ncbi:hypothetical protein Zmor_011119 [Zophobas morio]|uniref:Uncharacterized protein n=1 Tax=Zophobas morio TaxID=2755281 RepID=A0AA38IM54_9CUCU|nr:hypothetical protein Zmor_011119 [Zophobas morio]
MSLSDAFKLSKQETSNKSGSSWFKHDKPFPKMKVLSCHSSVFYILIKPALKQISTMVYMSIRNISSTEITKNITILSSKKKEAKVLNFKLERPENKPLVVMLSWLLAKQKHIYKYADFYINRGFDVMNINITPWQMLWPLRGTQNSNGQVEKSKYRALLQGYKVPEGSNNFVI